MEGCMNVDDGEGPGELPVYCLYMPVSSGTDISKHIAFIVYWFLTVTPSIYFGSFESKGGMCKVY